MVFDRNGRIIQFNRACESLTGYTFDEVQGQKFWEQLLLPEERAAAQDNFAHLLASRFPEKSETHWVTKDGRRRLIAWSTTAVCDSDGAVVYLVSAGIDVTEREKVQQAQKLAVIEERQRLARELHDSVTQAIYSVVLYADAARMALAAGKQDVVAEHLQELRSMAREAMLDMRLLIFELHPPVLEKEGLATAVQTRLETVEARSGLQSAFHVEGEESRLPLPIEEDLYRIVQEALTNAVKHAKAQQVTVRLRFGDHHFGMEIGDDGIGFDPSRARQSGGLGLRSIEERVQRIGGRLDVESAPDKGTVLKVEVDL